MKTASGFECDIKREKLDNMELVDAIADADEKNVMAVSRVVSLLFTPDQKKRLYDHHRRDDGTVPVDAVVAEIKEIFDLMGDDGKKS